MKREKIDERFLFDEEDKEIILRKSGQKCAHCGKPIFILPSRMENAMTVDHYIPLSRGGANRLLNYIPLCKDCNTSKGEKVISPDGYLKYLKPEYLKEIQGYYDSYIHSFKYISERNLLAADEFTVKVPFYPLNGMREISAPAAVFEYNIKKAGYCDLDKLYRYYLKYLKKYDVLETPEKAEENIRDWFERGCIYFAEKNGDILVMVAFDVVDLKTRKVKGYNGKALEIWSFSYYNRQQAGELLAEMVFRLPETIMSECSMPALPIMIARVKNDRIYNHISIFKDLYDITIPGTVINRTFGMLKKDESGMALCSSYFINSEDRDKIYSFMKDFRPIDSDDEDVKVS